MLLAYRILLYPTSIKRRDFSCSIKNPLLRVDFLRLFDLYVEGVAAFWAIAYMLPLDARQADLRLAMRAFAVDVRLSVFPFVFMQKELSFRPAHKKQILAVFLRALVGFSGKHTVKHENTDRSRNAVQRYADGIVFHKYRKYRKNEINGEQCV